MRVYAASTPVTLWIFSLKSYPNLPQGNLLSVRLLQAAQRTLQIHPHESLVLPDSRILERLVYVRSTTFLKVRVIQHPDIALTIAYRPVTVGVLGRYEPVKWSYFVHWHRPCLSGEHSLRLPTPLSRSTSIFLPS